MGRNLYTMAIAKALASCVAGGVVAAVAPFGWTRGDMTAEFRRVVKGECSEIRILGFRKRRGIFDGVNQDVGIQLFRKKARERRAQARLWFAYEGDSFRQVRFSARRAKRVIDPSVRVGSVVWNREDYRLRASSRYSLPLIYGGNIRPGGRLDMRVRRYRDRQYVAEAWVEDREECHAPFIALRRTLRGRPGAWTVDACLVLDPPVCVAENHVLVVELPDDIPLIEGARLVERLCDELVRQHAISGTPHITVAEVRRIVGHLVRRLAA